MIYVIEKGCYSDRHPVYATTNYTAAQKFLDKVNDENFKIYEFEDYVPSAIRQIEHEVWHICFDAETVSCRYCLWECTAADFLCELNWYGVPITQEDLKYFVNNGYCIVYSDANFHGDWHIYLNTEQDCMCNKETEEKFEKIAKDYLMMYLAEKEGIN